MWNPRPSAARRHASHSRALPVLPVRAALPVRQGAVSKGRVSCQSAEASSRFYYSFYVSISLLSSMVRFSLDLPSTSVSLLCTGTANDQYDAHPNDRMDPQGGCRTMFI
eukprot:Selendium_serpulae@DN101_c0_g1_i1.p1